MIYTMAAIYDVKAEFYQPPQFVRSKGEAIRMFKDALNGGDPMMTAHPEDFKLWYLGEFDALGGKLLLPHDGKSLIGRGEDYKDWESQK